MTDDPITLPPLPQSVCVTEHSWSNLYSVEQMQAFARAAVLADRAARAAAPAEPVADVVERAQLWLAEADRLGINVTDDNGYLAVISDLVSEVEFQRTALQGYRNEQERLIDQCDRAWKEVDAIAKERDRATKA